MLLNGMDTRKLFGEVDYAVGEALNNRHSQLDRTDLEEWTDEMLKQDAEEVKAEIARVCAEYGWTVEEYNVTYDKVRLTRHAPNHLY